MTNKEKQSDDIAVTPLNINEDGRKMSTENDNSFDTDEEKKKRSGKSMLSFLYNPKKRTVLGRDGLNWGK